MGLQVDAEGFVTHAHECRRVHSNRVRRLSFPMRNGNPSKRENIARSHPTSALRSPLG